MGKQKEEIQLGSASAPQEAQAGPRGKPWLPLATTFLNVLSGRTIHPLTFVMAQSPEDVEIFTKVTVTISLMWAVVRSVLIEAPKPLLHDTAACVLRGSKDVASPSRAGRHTEAGIRMLVNLSLHI